MNTVSLQKQITDDGAVLLAILQEAHADDAAQPWRLTAALDDFEVRGGIEALQDLAFEYTPAHIDEDDDTAPASCACPKCGERNIDNLALDDDEVVICQTCGEVYDISGAAQLERVMLEDDGGNWSDKYALAHPGALM